jgi:hypothetical protein
MTCQRRVIREEALNKAVAVFRGQQSDKADQSKIVPDSAERQREMKSPGKYMVPKYNRSVQQGIDGFKADLQDIEGVDGYDCISELQRHRARMLDKKPNPDHQVKPLVIC